MLCQERFVGLSAEVKEGKGREGSALKLRYHREAFNRLVRLMRKLRPVSRHMVPPISQGSRRLSNASTIPFGPRRFQRGEKRREREGAEVR